MTQTTRRRALASALPFLVALPALARRASAAEPTVTLDLPVDRYELDNGLEVLLLPDRTTPGVFVDVWYHVGSGDETAGKSGFAHLFEHMMFQGSKHVGEDRHFPILNAAGGRDVNGSTNRDRTNYFELVPAHALETALWLESDRMGYLLPMVTQKSFANQLEVVLNERRQRYENAAFGAETFAIGRGLYPEGHPYRHLTIGLSEDLKRASLEDVRAFFKKWYVPSNATIFIGGDVDVERAKALVAKYFGSFPKGARPARVVPRTPTLAARKRETITDRFAPNRSVRWVWISPKRFGDGDAELAMLAGVLSTRLTMALGSQARGAGASQTGHGFSGEFHVYVDLAPAADLAAVEAKLQAEIEKAVTALVEPRELNRALAARESGFVRTLESIASRGELLQGYAHYRKDARSLDWDLARFRSATREKIRAVAAEVLTDKRLEIVTLPANPAATARQGGN